MSTTMGTAGRTAAQPVLGDWLLEVGDQARHSPEDAIALDEVLAQRVGTGESPPLLRIWENDRALVMPRWRLGADPVGTVIDRFGHKWPICSRCSGGSTVAHGPGTLNMSLIAPLSRPDDLSIDDAYRLWVRIVANALRDVYGLTVEANEVDGAFCRGRYDVVADGRKLAGTAQARRRGSVLVHGTILVDVDRADYVRLIEVAESRACIPSAPGSYDRDRIVCLRELLGSGVTAEDLPSALLRASGIGPAAHHGALLGRRWRWDG